jgi:hypothetical protein
MSITGAARLTQAAVLLARTYRYSCILSASKLPTASHKHLSTFMDNKQLLDHQVSFEQLDNAEIAVSRVKKRHDETLVRARDDGLLIIHRYLSDGHLFPEKRDAVIRYMTDNGYTRVERNSAETLPPKAPRQLFGAPKYDIESALPEDRNRVDWLQPYVIPTEDSFEFSVHYFTPKQALEKLRATAATATVAEVGFGEPDNDGTIVQLPSETTTDMGRRWRQAHPRSFPSIRRITQAAAELGDGPKDRTRDYVVTSNPDSLMAMHALMRLWYPHIPVFVTPAAADTGMGFAEHLYFIRRDAPMTMDEAHTLVNP